MAQQHINLGTPPGGTDGDTNRTAWIKAEANFNEVYAELSDLSTTISPCEIVGLKLIWVGSNALTVGSGLAFVQGRGKYLPVPSAIAKTGIALGASTWYHVYLFAKADGTPDVEIVTDAPATPYAGTARSKTGDTSRRYIGSVRTDATAKLIQMQHDAFSNKVTYLGADYSLRNLLSNGVATAATAVSAANIVPVTAISVDILVSNTASTGPAITSNSTAALPLGAGAGSSYFSYCGSKTGMVVPNHPVDGSRAFTYRYLSAPDGGVYIDLNAYTFER